MINKNWKSHWKLVALSKNNTAEHMIQYCLLKALSAKSQNKLEIAQSMLRAAFTPVTNKTQLANGRSQYDTLEYALYLMKRNPTTIFGLDVSLFMGSDGIEAYNNLLASIPQRDTAANEPDYLFLFVRQDISKEQQAVQVSHAAFKAGFKMSERNVDPSKVNFVLVGLENEHDLANAYNYLTHNKITKCHSFYEPDLGDTLTAVATEPMKQHEKRGLKHYKTLKFD